MINYGSSLYNSKELKECAEKFARCLPKDVTALATTGTSGCALASAIIVRSDLMLKHINILREGELSHNGKCSGIMPSRSDIVAFIDDFISSGNSLKRVVNFLSPRGIKIRYVIVGLVHDIFIGKNPSFDENSYLTYEEFHYLKGDLK
jgi:orotate phosphoribosyltransferase